MATEQINSLKRELRAKEEKKIQERDAKISVLEGENQKDEKAIEDFGRGVMSPEETIEIALARLQDGGKEFRTMLLNHLVDCQTQKSSFLQTELMHLYLANERNFHVWLRPIITPELLKEVGASLPNTGLSKKEREKKIEELKGRIKKRDDEILKLLT